MCLNNGNVGEIAIQQLSDLCGISNISVLLVCPVVNQLIGGRNVADKLLYGDLVGVCLKEILKHIRMVIMCMSDHPCRYDYIIGIGSLLLENVVDTVIVSLQAEAAVNDDKASVCKSYYIAHSVICPAEIIVEKSNLSYGSLAACNGGIDVILSPCGKCRFRDRLSKHLAHSVIFGIYSSYNVFIVGEGLINVSVDGLFSIKLKSVIDHIFAISCEGISLNCAELDHIAIVTRINKDGLNSLKHGNCGKRSRKGLFYRKVSAKRNISVGISLFTQLHQKLFKSFDHSCRIIARYYKLISNNAYLYFAIFKRFIYLVTLGISYLTHKYFRLVCFICSALLRRYLISANYLRIAYCKALRCRFKLCVSVNGIDDIRILTAKLDVHLINSYRICLTLSRYSIGLSIGLTVRIATGYTAQKHTSRQQADDRFLKETHKHKFLL